MARYYERSGTFYLDTPGAARDLAARLNDILYAPFVAAGGKLLAVGATSEIKGNYLYLSETEYKFPGYASL
jgi:hypothetical protein